MVLRKKIKERSMKSIERELWGLCKKVVLERDSDKSGNVSCYTCGVKNLQGANKQLGHAYSKGALGASMRYDIRILKFQDFRCNIFFGGMQAVFWKNLEQELGKKSADKLYEECRRSKGVPIKAREYYLKLIETYKNLNNQN